MSTSVRTLSKKDVIYISRYDIYLILDLCIDFGEKIARLLSRELHSVVCVHSVVSTFCRVPTYVRTLSKKDLES